ncbi:unnamed protein product [Oikopleura dioica]|uniref:RING-type domain-containing protein n=1 Tax=Oikopleura dioica TaxID=34765 RepID=E4XX30_OIKDI|nr:unnamed protein product [Oikopleura dioica]
MVVDYNLDVEEECPLCIELLNHDLNFFPCECAFQICSICWNRIKELEGNLCPNCRTPYSEEPFSFKQLTEKQEALIVQRDQRSNNNTAVVKPKIAPVQDKEKLRDVRVMQKNLVFVVGLQPKLADESALRKQEYFGRFGKIMKVAVNQCTTYAGVQGPSASAYVTFSTTDAALKCIQMVHGLTQDGRTLKATLGTTKYCSRFLNGQQCKLTDCMYLHEIADPDASFTKEDMQKQKHTEYERRLMDNFRRAQQAEQARKEAAERERRLREQLRKKEEAAEASRKKAAAKATPRQEAKRPRKPPTTPTAASVTARPAPPKPKSPKAQLPKKNIYVDSDDEAEIERFTSKQSKEAVEEDVKDSWDTSDEEDCHKSSNSGKSSKSNSKPTSRAPSRNATPAEVSQFVDSSNSAENNYSRPNSRSSKSSSNQHEKTLLFENNTQSQSVTNQSQSNKNSDSAASQKLQMQSHVQSQPKSATNGKSPPPNLDQRQSTIGKSLFGNGNINSQTIPLPVASADEQMPSQSFHQPVVSKRLQARSPVEQSQPSGLMFDPFALNNCAPVTQSRLGAPPGVSKANRSPPGFSGSSSSSFPTSSNHNSQSTSSHQPFNPFDSFFSQDSVKLQDSLPNTTNSQSGSLFNRLPTVDQLKDPFSRKPAVQTNGVSISAFATPPIRFKSLPLFLGVCVRFCKIILPGLAQSRKDWESSSARAGVAPSSLSRRAPPAGLFDTGSSLSSSKLVPGLDGVDPLLFAGGSGRVDPPTSSLMPRSIPDLLRNGDSGMGRSRQDSVDLDNLDFDPIDYSMKGLSKMQLNESRARRTHASSPQQPNRSLFGDLQAPIGMMGLFGERPVPRQQSGKDEGHWQENLRRLLPNVNVHFQYSEQMQSRQAASSFPELKTQLPRGPPGLGGPPGFSQSPLLGFPDAGNAFARQNSRQPFESEFIPKGLLD